MLRGVDAMSVDFLGRVFCFLSIRYYNIKINVSYFLLFAHNKLFSIILVVERCWRFSFQLILSVFIMRKCCFCALLFFVCSRVFLSKIARTVDLFWLLCL